MPEPPVVGLQPWLPWPLNRWRWLTEPVRAERLAALRIGLGLCLVFDVLATYLPQATVYFGPDSLGDPAVFANRGHWFHTTPWNVVPWRDLGGPAAVYTFLGLWALAAVALTVGLASNLAAILCWVGTMTALNLNPGLHNAGDAVKAITLFNLMFSPCGAAWSVDAWRAGRRGPVWVPPWALRLLFIQLCLIYGLNGLYKMLGGDWPAGLAMYLTLGFMDFARFPATFWPFPFEVTQILTWVIVSWELFFPVLVCVPRLRTATLILGVVFHVGLAITMEINMFAPYMLCLYLPLVPWERWADGSTGGPP